MAEPATRGKSVLDSWVLVAGFKFSDHSKEATLFITDPYYGNLN